MAHSSSSPKLLVSNTRDGLEPAAATRDTVDLTEIWASIRRRRATVFSIAALVFTGVIGATLASPMTFRANSRLYLGELSNNASSTANAEDQLDLLGPEGGDVGSEMEIIRSRSLVERAVLDSGLNVQIFPAGVSQVRYWQWLWNRRDPRLLDASEQGIKAVDTKLSNDAFSSRVYRVVFHDPRNFEVFEHGRSMGRGVLGESLRTNDFILQLQEGRRGPPRSGAEYVMSVAPLTEVVDTVLDNLEVTAAKTPLGADPVKVISLGFAARSPYFATTFLERLMAAYLEERKSWKTEDASSVGSFVSSQLTGMRETLDQIEQKLADYRTKNRVVVLDNEAKAMIEQVGKYEEQRVAARLEVSALADVNRALKDPNIPTESFMVGEAKDTVLEGMATSLAKSRQTLVDLESRFNESAPNLREQRAQVDAQQAAIKSYVSGRLQRAQENLGTLNQIIGQFEQRLRTVPGAELGLTQLARESEVYSNLYSYLLKRQQQAAIIKASTVSKNRILDAPQAPYREDSPKLLLRLASLPLGFLLGALGVVLSGAFGGRIQSESELRHHLAAPVVGRLPTRRGRRRRKSETLADFDFPDETRDPDWLEACRTLRANVYRMFGGPEQGVVLVTSPAKGDGKTLCVLSLAELFAADGKSTLVIETQLREPSATGMPDDGPDMLDVLQGTAHWRDAVRFMPTPFGEFHVLSANAAAPPELLSAGAMRDLMREVRSHYDIVIMDVSSYPSTSDALVLTPHANCILSVVRLQRTRYRSTIQHFRELAHNVPHALVLNDVETESTRRIKPLGARRSVRKPERDRVSQITAAAEFMSGSTELEA